jgi:hypothetical protein
MKVHHFKKGCVKVENGIIKTYIPFDNYAFVVYKCSGDWANYRLYTGVSTHLHSLRPGWMVEETYEGIPYNRREHT